MTSLVHPLVRYEEFVRLPDPEGGQRFEYRPAPEYQFWYADVAVIRRQLTHSMATWNDYRCYAPDVVIEVLSPSNTAIKVNRQRLASMSNATREFWVIDADRKTVAVSTLTGVREYDTGDSIVPLEVGGSLSLSEIFDGI